MPSLQPFRSVVARIPRGRVITYGEVAKAAGFPRAARLTVRALQGGTGLPWHRVVAAGGRIALPGEEGREQRLRLEMEGVTFRGHRVRMELYGWRPRSRARRWASSRVTVMTRRPTTKVRRS
jgi:methylated-DNA-protein-cysteine methyltransferase related protein